MARFVRQTACTLAAAALLCAGLGGCSRWRKPVQPEPRPRVARTPRPAVPGGEERITITAYFADPAAAALVPTKRAVRSTREAAAQDALQALIEGPLPDEGLEGVMPKGTASGEVTLRGNVARVRMDKAFRENFPKGGTFGNLCVYAIVNTLTSIEGIDAVAIEVPGGGKLLGELDVSEPLKPNDELVAAK